ncbi:hypothetical protein K432DRAFT_423358 [Lepidopterella palustris CBS 459.81]|uniref:G protein-coupled receptor GPR1/2/3 C-terminal domain-containing protein n=1 Tax=Lepidopterella palustris CBS 459.81 TaxID=1314670 RepID=A0A8E2EGB6_9PEZI|nr:hypothetical protein K432DRAFT_423358 [Lepidopterella palustris CBS 459.81]
MNETYSTSRHKTSQPLAEAMRSEPSERRPSTIAIETGIKRSETAGTACTAAKGLIFIHPIAYICMWILPFALRCMQYQNHYAQHPLFILNVLATFRHTFKGAVYIIFNVREKPWSDIPTSHSTFGSFRCWRSPSPLPSPNQEVVERRLSSSAGMDASPMTPATIPVRLLTLLCFKPLKPSNSSEQQKAGAELAYERLKVEQDDRRKANMVRDMTAEQNSGGVGKRGRLYK